MQINGDGQGASVVIGNGSNGAEGIKILGGVQSLSGSAAGVLVHGAVSGPAVQLGESIGGPGGVGLAVFAGIGGSGNNAGLDIKGQGAGHGVSVLAGDTGWGMSLSADTHGYGLAINGGSGFGDAVFFTSATGYGLDIVGFLGGTFMNATNPGEAALQLEGATNADPDMALTGSGRLQADLGGRILGNTNTIIVGVGVRAAIGPIIR